VRRLQKIKLLVCLPRQTRPARDGLAGRHARLRRPLHDVAHQVKMLGSPIAARNQEFGAGLEGLGTWHEEPEGAGQAIDRIEREADRKGILNLLA
jgi:hypothetical protein